MNIKILFGLLAFVFIVIFSTEVQAFPLCEQEVAPNTRCQMTTPILNCTSYTYDLVNLSSSTVLIDDGIMTEVVPSSGLYNFTFIQPEGTYEVILCNNQTRQMYVRPDLLQRDDNSDTNRIYLVTLLIAAGLFFLGELTKDFVFPMISGTLLVVLAVYTAQTGFTGFANDFVNNAFIIILAAIGMYLLARYGYDWIMESFVT